MTLDFCAIDFETANSARGSACAVGLVKVLDGQVVESRHLRMRPPEELDWFDDFNISLHGITPDAVRTQPRFAERLPEILDFSGTLPLVAHNAAFDVGVMRDACDASGLEWPALRYACTLVLSRRLWNLLSYSLPWVVDAAGVPFDQHHDPLADAQAAAAIMTRIAKEKSCSTIEAVLAASYCVLGSVGPGSWDGCHYEHESAPLPAANADADPTHPFYGREMVFTGALASMTRRRAWELVAERGGKPASGVTKDTTVLVVGYQDARRLRPGETLSSKARKAAALRQGGQLIELMGEVDFVQLLEL